MSWDDTLVGPGEAERVAHMLAIVWDRVDPPGLRVLDLACRTGAFSVALADAGADVLGIEGRLFNLEHAPVHDRVTYELGDVRDLRIDRRFDVTLCLGILYHLNAPDALRLLARMRAITTRFAVVDTHIGGDAGTVIVDGREYRGWPYGEAGNHPWSSLDDQQVSWWFTTVSLADAFRAAGWTEITQVPGQGWSGETADRRWLVIA